MFFAMPVEPHILPGSGGPCESVVAGQAKVPLFCFLFFFGCVCVWALHGMTGSQSQWSLAAECGTTLLAPVAQWCPFFLLFGKGPTLKLTNQKKDARFSHGHWASELLMSMEETH